MRTIPKDKTMKVKMKFGVIDGEVTCCGKCRGTGVTSVYDGHGAFGEAEWHRETCDICGGIGVEIKRSVLERIAKKYFKFSEGGKK